jgi:hypothetical protein
MKRRTLLRRTGAAGATLAVSGCLRRSYDEDALSIEETRFDQSEDGYFVYELTVSNTADHDASGTVYVTGALNGESTTKVRQLSLNAHSTQIVRIEYDVKDKNVTNFEPQTSITED